MKEYKNKYGVLYNCDCMEYMKTLPNKYFELAIVDPPYGLNVNKMTLGSGKYKNKKNWDNNIPNKNYFDELFRISKNQIIWGVNYFTPYLPSSMGWIFWDKMNGSSDFSDGELAYSSFNRALRKINIHLSQDKSERFYPTQKPVALYKWLLINYAKEDDKIFDSHVGSASSFIACMELGFNFTGCELDEDYFNNSIKRIKQKEAELEKKFYIKEEDNLLFKNLNK